MSAVAHDFPDDSDGDALRRLVESGADLTVPMKVDFQVAMLDDASSKELAKLASKYGYRCAVYPNEVSSGWTCECSTRMLVTYEALLAIQGELAHLSRRFGGKPDGWGTFGNVPPDVASE